MKTFSFKAKIFLASLLALGFQTASAITLDEAYSAAAGNSSEVKQLRWSSESARLNETKAFAGYLPHLELSGRHLFAEKFEELEIAFGGANFVMPAIQPYSSFGLTASYEIFSGFQTASQVEAARIHSDASKLAVKRAEEQLHAGIRTLFYKALASQILVDVTEQNIRTLEGHAHDVDARIRSGISTRYDLLRVEVQLEDARTERVAAANSVSVARGRLFQAMGIADEGQPLIGELPTDFSRFKVDALTVKDVTRADRDAETLQASEAHSMIRAANSHWMPKVSLFGNQEWYNNVNHSLWESDARYKPAYSVGMMVKWSLFDGDANVASEKQAVLAEKIANEKVAQFDQALPVDLEESKKRFSYDVINYKAKLTSVRKAEEAVRLARGGVRAGTRTNTETLDAVVDLNRAKAATVKAQVDAIEALGQLELIVGHAL